MYYQPKLLKLYWGYIPMEVAGYTQYTYVSIKLPKVLFHNISALYKEYNKLVEIC